MKILVTGAKGMLGTDVCDVLAKNHEVIPRDIDDFDITNLEATVRAFRSIGAEVTIHLAAFTDVEACEDRRTHAFRCNGLATMYVAKAARQIGSRLIYLSTDYVFDGTKREPYLETDPPAPINFYGLTKLYGEAYVRQLMPEHLIIRTSWLFGPNGRNFIDTILAKARQGEPLRVVDDQRGCPTYTLDLARGLANALEAGLEGTLHMTNSGDTTWFGLAEHALALAGIAVDIRPVTTDAYPSKARRPANSVLASLVGDAAGLEPLPGWQDALKHHLDRKTG
jgi:dTDP-4-dehydrorhamnose reductase